MLKAAVHHTYSCQRARTELGYAPRLNSTGGMERVAAAFARKRQQETSASRTRGASLVLNALSLCVCAMLVGAAIVSSWISWSWIPLPQAKRLIDL